MFIQSSRPHCSALLIFFLLSTFTFTDSLISFQQLFSSRHPESLYKGLHQIFIIFGIKGSVILCIARVGKNARDTIVQSKQCTYNSAVGGVAWLKGLLIWYSPGTFVCPSQHLATLNIALNCAAMLSVQIIPPNFSDLIWIEWSKVKSLNWEWQQRPRSLECVLCGLRPRSGSGCETFYLLSRSAEFVRELWQVQFEVFVGVTI